MVRKRLRFSGEQPRGQGIVEFAIVLPVVLMVVFGIIELGFLIFSYSSVNSASREAARYGIAIGDVGAGQRYYDCSGIVTAGMRIGRFAGMDTGDFTIVYDNGPDEGDGSYVQKYSSCADLASHNGADTIRFGDRIVVTVNHDYHPIVSIMGLNINPFTMTSTSSRTIVKNAEVIPGGGSSSPGGGGGEGSPPCYSLTRSYIGNGSQPNASPAQSTDCENPGTYVAGEPVSLEAVPAGGYTVGSWSGTNNDASKTLTNAVTMPAADHNVTVTYVSGSPTCYTLSLSHTPDGTGSDPSPDPANSPGCGAGYVAGETINLTVTPNIGYTVDGWTGTSNNASTDVTNSLTMPAADHSASVIYIIGP